MRLVVNDIELFKSVFRNIELLSDSTDFILGENGLKLSVLSRGHTIFYECIFDRSFFTEYECERMDIFSLDSGELKKILRKCKGDELELSFDESCTIRNGSKEFELNLLEVEYDAHPGLPSIPYIYSIDVPIGFLKESLKDSEMFSNEICLMTANDLMRISSMGVLGRYSNECHSDKELDASVSYYSIEKVMTILGADKVSDRIMLKGGTDLPLVMEISNLADDVRLTGLVAPIQKKQEP